MFAKIIELRPLDKNVAPSLLIEPSTLGQPRGAMQEEEKKEKIL